MNQLMFVLVVSSAAALALPFSSGAQEKRFQLVGFTEATFDGEEGVLNYTLACQAEFSASRFCSVGEVAATVVVPALPPGPALPNFSGPLAWINSKPEWPELVTDCSNWVGGLGATGLIVDNTGGIAVSGCTQFRRVSCCALTPIPEPPQAMLLPSGVAGLAGLSWLRGRSASVASQGLLALRGYAVGRRGRRFTRP